MTENIIPISPLPSQIVNVPLGPRQGRVWIRQLGSGLYLDLWLDTVLTVAGRLCQNKVTMLMASSDWGDLYFEDTQGEDDPDYSGLGSRYLLIWRQ